MSAVALQILLPVRGNPSNPAKPDLTERREFTVDSGSTYSVVPEPVLRRLRVRPLGRETFELANGTTIVRRKGMAIFKYRQWIGGGDVIFGEKGDATSIEAHAVDDVSAG